MALREKAEDVPVKKSTEGQAETGLDGVGKTLQVLASIVPLTYKPSSSEIRC
jgi:hypothetical protein